MVKIFGAEINVSQPAGTAQENCCTCHVLTKEYLHKKETRPFNSIVPTNFAGELSAFGMIIGDHNSPHRLLSSL